MDRFTTHTGIAVPLLRDNIDTDQIMPKQFLKRIERSGFGEFVFYDWRFDEHGNKIPDFALNDSRYDGASIIISGNNFGCGSSREHAPWGLYEYGFKVIIAEGFADIFYNNCFKTGILPIPVPSMALRYLETRCRTVERYSLSIDLLEQTLTDGSGLELPFEIEPFRKYCLSNGLDDIGITSQFEKDIADYEAANSI
jgi:3-isopropylmalate/(R)-2-methylmalate dehydratase small subunit